MFMPSPYPIGITAIAEPGSYRVILIVDDGTGVSNATASDGLTVRVNAGPTAVVGPDLAVSVGERVPFDASGSYDPDGQIVSYAWDFDGDGQPDASDAIVVFTFPATGTYDIALTVVDDAGNEDTIITSVIAAACGRFLLHACSTSDRGDHSLQWNVVLRLRRANRQLCLGFQRRWSHRFHGVHRLHRLQLTRQLRGHAHRH